MTPNEYIESTRKFDTHDKYYQQLSSAFGLTAEAGEVSNEYERAYRVHPKTGMIQGLDVPKVKDELGDVLWHVSRLLDIHGWTFEEVMEANIAKLTERYEREGIPTH